MKSLFVIPVTLFALPGAALGILLAAHVSVRPIDALVAAVVATASAIIGLLPVMARRRSNDIVGIWQAALVGTVLHIMATLGVAGLFCFVKLVDIRGAFPLWMMAGYLISLVLLVLRLRDLALEATAAHPPATASKA